MANFFARPDHDRGQSSPAFTGKVVTGQAIGDLAVDPDSRALVATHHGASAVTVIDTTTAEVTSIIEMPGEPFALAATGDRAYVTTTALNHDAVVVVDTASRCVIAEYPLAFGVTSLAISPNGKKVFAGRSSGDHIDVAVIDITAERVGTIDVADGPGVNVDALRVDDSGTRLYVAATDDLGSRLAVVDVETARVVATVPMGDAPIRDLALGADATAYVLTSHRTRGGAIHVVDLSTHRVTDTISVGRAPVQLVLSADDARGYVVDHGQVLEVDLRTRELQAITVDARPSCVTLDADGSRLFVADYAGTVSTFTVASTPSHVPSDLLPTDRLPMPMLRREPVAV